MDDKLVRYTLRVDRLLFKKFRYIAESEGRSANKEIEQYLKKRVAEFEKENRNRKSINKATNFASQVKFVAFIISKSIIITFSFLLLLL